MIWQGIQRNVATGLLLAVVSLLSFPAQAEQRSIALVLDGSISMWAAMPGGEPRIKVMKEGVGQFLDDVAKTPAAKANWSMVTFGHRSKSKCNDTQLIKGSGDFDAVAMTAALAPLKNPKGRSLVAAAFKSAITSLGKVGNGQADVILVVDGRDRCAQDMCAVARKLKSDLPNSRAHVVGLNLADPDQAALACIFTLTGGTFANVKTSERLAAQLKLALGPMAPAAPKIDVSKRGVVLAARLGEKAPILTKGVTWVFTPQGDSSGKPKSVFQTRPDQLVDLAAGSYRVDARYQGLISTGHVKIEDGAPSVATVNFGGGLVVLEAPVLALGETRIPQIVQIHFSSGGKPQPNRVFAFDGRLDVAMEAGTYSYEAHSGTGKKSGTLTIAAGQTVELKPFQQMGMARLGAVAVNGGPMLDDVVFRVLQTDLDSRAGDRVVAITRGRDVALALEAGAYRLEAEARGTKARGRVLVRRGQITRQTLLLAIGEATFAAQLAGKTEKLRNDVRYTIEPVGGGREVNTSVSPARLNLEAGTYRVTARLGNGNAKAEKQVVVTAGGTHDIVLVVRAGRVKLDVDKAIRNSTIARPYWEVRDQGQNIVFTSSKLRPNPLLAYGTYEVSVTVGPTQLSKTIQVIGPDDLPVMLAAQ